MTSPLFHMDEDPLDLPRLLLARLERINADSFWAHRASGVRGALIRLVEKAEKGRPAPRSEAKRLIELGFLILEQAAREKIQS